ncbi:hypothetical protein [Arthrobacter sp. FW306-2-2C-D06B]|uniref:hypothetical protein n=1 Tax=Arthrobacter sp. FW306-2-2C-D06B TaxID=2879618 RepID=UPI001F4177C9|nr:hypothetical protein [Arthrobacter sp. FW306-2-2C-D06B]UKA60029.1 hypothetical protein LFT47_06730 [Arthrobacter sp. FW306-2-2C-D06B]
MDIAAVPIDGETVRLVATASGAVIAGLGGALIGGLFTRRTTRMTLEASNLSDAARWRREQQLEHDQWHRNRKQSAYENFLLEVENCRPFMMARELQTGMPDMSKLLAAKTQLKLIGAIPVRRTANTLMNNLTQLASAPSTGVSTEKHKLLVKYQYVLDQYVQSVRIDLGTATTEDEELTLENEENWKKVLGREGDSVGRVPNVLLEQARVRYGGA